MLRRELIRATSNVLAALEEAGFALLFESLHSRDEKNIKEKFLPTFSHYIKMYEKFGNAEKNIISILDLDALHDTKFWTMLMTSPEANKLSFVSTRIFRSIRSAEEHLPKILKLIERESDVTITTDNKKTEKKTSADALGQLSVTVIEDREKSTPERLVLVLQSIDGLYRACACLAGEQETGLSVESCDSGSDKAFDFLGAANVESVKEIILSFWDRLVYFREDKTGRRLELVAQSLPILDQIGAMKEAGKLEPERAELLKRQIVDSVTKFGKAGATIPEIDRATFHNPRQLMRPEPKLLVEPKYPEPEPTKKEEAENDTRPQIADPEFEEYMEKMAKDFLKRRGQSCNDNNNPDGMP